MSSTDTNQASELFELCRKVYEATGWKYTIGRFHNDGSYDGYVGHRGIAYTPNPQNAEWLPKDIPLYTSDYLLEKLPRYLRLQRDDMDYPQKFAFKLRSSTKDTNNWRAGYYNTPKKQVFQNLSIDCHADTPLKALLKLTIALSEAGELK